MSKSGLFAHFKSKDEIALEINLKQLGGEPIINQKFTAKAKSDGDDILSKVIESAAQLIVNKTKR